MKKLSDPKPETGGRKRDDDEPGVDDLLTFIDERDTNKRKRTVKLHKPAAKPLVIIVALIVIAVLIVVLYDPTAIPKLLKR